MTRLREEARRTLRLASNVELNGHEPSVEIDDYVPLRFCTCDEPLGGGYVRLGNYSTTLVELAVEPRSQVLRSVVITAFDTLTPWPVLSIVDTREALPALSTGFQSYAILDLHEDFYVSVRPCEALIHWAPLDGSIAYRCGTVHFLAVDEVLSGVWFKGLTDGQTRLFASHASKPR